MTTANIVLTVLIAVYFVGLIVVLYLDPSHLLDAYRRSLQSEK